ncbi:MAG TPA: circularly permuted type 2 ATP-grasp protein [Thermoleophilaceae bacterium]|nr:circularly permuted type 2 ATP-grasp protein [Thermoleophilaceae bacterium]
MSQSIPTSEIDYTPAAGFFDELFEGRDRPRPPASALVDTLRGLGRERLRSAGERRDAIFIQQGITFDASGPDGPVKDRPFPLDLVPRILPADEWRTIKRGLAQRVRAINLFVDDVYHEQEILRDGLVPWQLVVTRPAFARAAYRIRPPGGVWCHVSGCDLVRDADGRWKVLEDNVRTPSGISYVLENRIAMSRLLPELFAGYDVRPVSHYPALLLDALRNAAPSGGENPVVVVWTPGPANSAYFEHAFLARQMGVELVEASDLVVREGTCYMRTTRGLARVDSIYRRIDDDFMDPLEFRPDSLLGVPGLMGVYRAGNVAIANAVGTGVADDKAVYHYVPEMIRYYIGEEPILDNLQTWLLADAEQRAYALEHIGELVVKPTGESGGKGVFIGPLATKDQLADQRSLVGQAPERWIAQTTVALSTVPTALPDGSLAPRHVDLRPFAVYGDEIKIVPGGLTRVALREGSMIVNSSQGGGSKDTWVLADQPDAGPDPGSALAPPTMPDMRRPGWRGQDQQQQQQQRAGG